MFRMFEFAFAVLVISATLMTCAHTLPAESPNGVRRAASLLAKKSILPVTPARSLNGFAR